MNGLNILVISDLHTGICQEDNKDSKLYVDDDINIYGKSFIEYLKKLNKNIDLLVCSGDIGNKGNIESFHAGWKFINHLIDELKIPAYLCVPGNHDHQSLPPKNSSSGFSPKHELQFCTPRFPFDCFEKNTHFWAWNWAASHTEQYNAISLNSSAYHGYGDEFKHGRVAVEVSKQINSYLSSSKVTKKPLNILVCHHHPEKMEDVDEDYDYEAMDGAQYLLSSIQSADVGPWLIIHGHKHYATLSYASSRTGTPPTILSAGSFSAVLYKEIASRTSNQFYYLSVDLDETIKNGKVVGTFETHEANPLNSWQPSTSSNLPAKGGFGSLHTPHSILHQVKSTLSKQVPFLEGIELDPFKDMTKHLPPEDAVRLEKLLEENSISIERCSRNEIIQIGLTHA
jgi:hypothetical protein